MSSPQLRALNQMCTNFSNLVKTLKPPQKQSPKKQSPKKQSPKKDMKEKVFYARHSKHARERLLNGCSK